MKRTTQLFTLTTAILATIIITMVVSPADANKRYAIESGDIAFVDVFNLIDKALLVEEMANARADFNTESTQALGALKEQISQLEIQLNTMQPDDPNGAAVYQQYQAYSGQLQNSNQQISARYQTLIAQQITQGYREIYAAANEIGEQEGFAFVFATRADGELIQTDTITGITQEILARPLMTPPNGTDLTELVRIKLGYPEKAPEPVVEDEVTTETTTETTTQTDPEAAAPEAVTPAIEVPVTEDD